MNWIEKNEFRHELNYTNKITCFVIAGKTDWIPGISHKTGPTFHDLSNRKDSLEEAKAHAVSLAEKYVEQYNKG